MTDAKSSAAAASALPELTLTRIFDAPRSLVFKVWTEEAHVAKWWGPRFEAYLAEAKNAK